MTGTAPSAVSPADPDARSPTAEVTARTLPYTTLWALRLSLRQKYPSQLCLSLTAHVSRSTP